MGRWPLGDLQRRHVDRRAGRRDPFGGDPGRVRDLRVMHASNGRRVPAALVCSRATTVSAGHCREFHRAVSVIGEPQAVVATDCDPWMRRVRSVGCPVLLTAMSAGSTFTTSVRRAHACSGMMRGTRMPDSVGDLWVRDMTWSGWSPVGLPGQPWLTFTRPSVRGWSRRVPLGAPRTRRLSGRWWSGVGHAPSTRLMPRLTLRPEVMFRLRTRRKPRRRRVV